MKKLLIQLDTDPRASVFDAIVAHDGGADHLISQAGVTPKDLPALIDGAIFTRAPRDKKNTALFIGGSDMAAGEALLSATQKRFFGDFRVSVMLDCNGSNTTAAACVAKVLSMTPVAGKRAVVLAGTGPVGQRVCAMLARADCREIVLTSRSLERARSAANAIETRFGIRVTPLEAATEPQRASAVEGAQIAIACGASGVMLLPESAWARLPHLEVLADANATPPLGLGGIEMMDRGTERHGKRVWGAIGFGAFKLALHRACIGRLFESHTTVLDAEEIFDLARDMTTTPHT